MIEKLKAAIDYLVDVVDLNIFDPHKAVMKKVCAVLDKFLGDHSYSVSLQDHALFAVKILKIYNSDGELMYESVDGIDRIDPSRSAA
jgi:hypothetical protein